MNRARKLPRVRLLMTLLFKGNCPSSREIPLAHVVRHLVHGPSIIAFPVLPLLNRVKVLLILRCRLWK